MSTSSNGNIKPLKIVLIGYGKMGKAIEQIALQRGHHILAAIDADNRNLLNDQTLKNADVAIEFTGPDSVVSNLEACFHSGTPVVCGSSGWLDAWDDIKRECERAGTALLYASNFSIGVNIFFELNKKLAQLMSGHGEYDVMIEEIHHTEKKDAPSGTAISLAKQIIEFNPNKKSWTVDAAKEKNELQIVSKRIDPAPGTHTIKYQSNIDDISITHTAHNRQGFATGAVLAAEFLAGKTGIYSMQDVLGL